MGTCFDCYYGKKDICPRKNPYKKDECTHKRTEDDMKIERRRDAAVCEAYKSGKTSKEIGEEFNISQGTLYTILARNDVELRTNKPSDLNLPEKDILDALSSGLTQGEVAKKFGTTRYQIIKIQQRSINSPDKDKEKADMPSTESQEPIEETSYALYSNQFNKPHPSFHPAEKDGHLIWKSDIKNLEDLISISKAVTDKIVVENGSIYLIHQSNRPVIQEVAFNEDSFYEKSDCQSLQQQNVG